MQIYLTINKINGKMYIGKDTKSCKDYLGSGALIKKAVEKYGKNSFLKVILSDNIDCPRKLEEEEAKFIRIFNAVESKNFYNISSGFDSSADWLKKKVFQFSEDGKLIKIFDSLELACEEFGGSKGNLCNAASGRRNTWKGFRWSYTETPHKITEVKRGRKKGTKNSYEILRNHTNVTNTELLCYENDNFFKKFENQSDAADYFGTSAASINQYVVSGKKYRKKYTFQRGEKISKTIYKN